MGQYHYLVNFDRKEIVHPHKLDLGAKQIEHTHTVASFSDVLYMLMTTSPNRGGGDLRYDEALEQEFQTFGRWVGDRVAVFGDYTEWSDIPFMTGGEDPKAPYNFIFDRSSFTDISDDILGAFQLAFDVEYERDSEGWNTRKLTSRWDWLLGSKN